MRNEVLTPSHQSRTDEQLIEDALAIWQAGVDAVRADRLVRDAVRVEGQDLWIADAHYDLRRIRRIVVVGAGKAGAGMSEGLEQALGPDLIDAKQVRGWVNVPEDCVRPLGVIHLHGARPAGLNEPTAAGVEGTGKILEMVGQLSADDLCVVLLSGGGSALLPAPVDGVSLADKQALTRFLSAAGANIAQLNTVRKQLSRVKGGGLARACRAGQLVTLVISDVLGDPLDIIASGPTVVEDSSTPQRAREILQQFAAEGAVPESIFEALDRAAARTASPTVKLPQIVHAMLGNNAVAVDGAGVEAVARGYSHAMIAAQQLESDAEVVGAELADQALRLRFEAGPDCLISGGEPTVKLVPSSMRGRGGRNQQLVLAALQRLLANSPAADHELDGIVILSGGTDGEDGPTDAAGAYFDAFSLASMREQGLQPDSFLTRNDAYHFFQPLHRLLLTGPTHTNVGDLRVVVVRKKT